MSRETAKNSQTELAVRAQLFNSLLAVPHREVAKVRKAHQDVVKQDPRFYVRFASWYFDKGEIRDHKEMFISTLCIATEEETKFTDPSTGGDVFKTNEDSALRNVGLALLSKLPPYQVSRVVKYVKEVANPPRSLRTEVTRYLRER